MDKPASCIGCPLYGDGHGFVPDELVPGNSVLIVGQNPGATEERTGRPFCGDTGKALDDVFLPAAGLERGQVSVANVLKCRATDGQGRKTNNLPTNKAALDQAMTHCMTAHFHVPPETTLIVAQGGLAFKALGGTGTISTWRGFVLPQAYEGRPVYTVLHIADLFRDARMAYVAQYVDWPRLGKVLDGTWPSPIPERLLVDEDSIGEVETWFQSAAAGKYVVIDTEYARDTHFLTILGIAWYGKDWVPHGLQVNWRTAPPWMKAAITTQLRQLVRAVPTVFHNFAADMPVLRQNLSIAYSDYRAIEDTMLAHSVLWSELPHDLEFLQSVYGQYPKLKHLADTQPLDYNWGDVLATGDTLKNMLTGFLHDHGAERVYREQSLKLIPTILAAHDRGIRVNKARVAEVRIQLLAKKEAATAIAQSALGWPINLGSPEQLKTYLYEDAQYPIQTAKQSKKPTVDDDAIAVLRQHVGPPFDPDVEQEGFTEEYVLQRVTAGADPVLEARVMYVEAQHALDNYIMPLYHGASIVDRVYPTFSIHIQKTGRWSTSNPPLAQLPSALRDIVCPDEDECWVEWDWSAIEPRFLQALCNSQILKKAFDEGIDLHTWTVCSMFGYEMPPNLLNPHTAPENEAWRQKYSWKGGSDPRRVFAKAGRYEMYYGGIGNNAAAAAIRFGLDPKALKQALRGLLTADPAYYKWRQELIQQVRRTRIIRSNDDRPRRLLGRGQEIERQALNHPMQAGVSWMFNMTIFAMREAHPEAHFAWGMHDSQKYAIKLVELSRDKVQAIQAIAERAVSVRGKVVRFPAEMTITYPPDYTGPRLEGYE